MALDLAALSDGELATLSLAGRDSAFAEIVRRHREALFRLARAHVGDADEALDLVQEAFVSAHRALRRYDPDRPLRTWLSAITLNKCRDWGRKRAVRRFLSFAVPIDDAIVRGLPEDRPGVDVEAADREALARVARAIAELPAPLKEALILRTIDGMTQADAAALLGVSEKAVETRLYRARAKLTEKLAGG